MNNVTRLIVRENPRLIFGFSDTTQFQSPLFPMKSELENKEEIIKKQIEVIRELNKINSELYNDIKELGEDLQSQDTGIKALVQDWKELREDCAKQTKELKSTKDVVQLLLDRIKLMGEMNNELQVENLRLKNRNKSLEDTPCIPYINPYTNHYPYNPPYVFCTSGGTTINNT